MIYFVRFNNLLPDEKMFFYNREDITRYLDKILQREIAFVKGEIVKLKEEDEPSETAISFKQDILYDLQEPELEPDIEEYTLEGSISVTILDDDMLPKYKKIFNLDSY